MRVAFQITFPEPMGLSSSTIVWGRRTVDLISSCEFGSDRAIQLSDARHPDLPGLPPHPMCALCDSQVSAWGDEAPASAIGLLWSLARLTLGCADETGHSDARVTRAGMTVMCQLLPG